jgi:hypothetical protein
MSTALSVRKAGGDEYKLTSENRVVTAQLEAIVGFMLNLRSVNENVRACGILDYSTS